MAIPTLCLATYPQIRPLPFRISDISPTLVATAQEEEKWLSHPLPSIDAQAAAGRREPAASPDLAAAARRGRKRLSADAGFRRRTTSAGGAPAPPGWPAPSAELPDPEDLEYLSRESDRDPAGPATIGHLNRWVDEKVRAAITIQRRQRTAGQSGSRPTRRQPCTRSTCSSPPLAVEVAAHFKLGRRSIALAFRLGVLRSLALHRCGARP